MGLTTKQCDDMIEAIMALQSSLDDEDEFLGESIQEWNKTLEDMLEQYREYRASAKSQGAHYHATRAVSVRKVIE